MLPVPRNVVLILNFAVLTFSVAPQASAQTLTDEEARESDEKVESSVVTSNAQKRPSVDFIAGLGTPVGTAGLMFVHPIYPNGALELGAGYSMMTDLNMAANYRHEIFASESTSVYGYTGFTYTRHYLNNDRQKRNNPDSSVSLGSSDDHPYDEPGTYNAYWANLGFGAMYPMPSRFTYGWSLGLTLGKMQGSTGADVFVKDNTYYRSKDGYKTVFAISIVPVRLSFSL